MKQELAFEERLNRFMEATEKRAAEFDRELAKSKAEADKRAAEADRRKAELDASLKKMHEEIFGTGQNAGYHAEQYFQNVLKDKLAFGGEQYDCMLPNLKYEGRESCEFGIVLVNGSSVAIIEAKHRIHPKFVKDVVEKKAAQFRKYFPVYGNYKLYLGVAGFSFDNSVVEEAKEYGVGILRQAGGAVVESGTENLKAY